MKRYWLALALFSFAVFSTCQTKPVTAQSSVPPIVQSPPPETGPVDDDDIQHQLTQLESAVWQLEVNQERMFTRIAVLEARKR